MMWPLPKYLLRRRAADLDGNGISSRQIDELISIADFFPPLNY
jgi:hypothetical protein